MQTIDSDEKAAREKKKYDIKTQHAWYEPAAEFAQHARIHTLPYITPERGKLFQVNSHTKDWWHNYQ